MKIKRVSDQFVRSFKLRAIHISDTHGNFPSLRGKFDCVIHTGDLFPNSHHVMAGNRVKEMAFQLQWLRDSLPNIKSWLQGYPMLFILGNHDFLNPDVMELELRSLDIEAFNVTDKILSFQNVNFYGFPYIPAINGMWNYERELPEMGQEVDKMVEVINKTYVDVLACHAPPFKMLDLSRSNQLLGSTVIADALSYKVNPDMMPAYYLCGHIHEAHGVSIRNGIVYSNAATTQHIVEIG